MSINQQHYVIWLQNVKSCSTARSEHILTKNGTKERHWMVANDRTGDGSSEKFGAEIRTKDTEDTGRSPVDKGRPR